MGVVGLGLGALIGALAFGGDDAPGAPTGAGADSAAGCQLLAGLPDQIPDDFGADEGWTIEDPYLWRLQGAAGAFSAAGTAGGDYRSLDDQGEMLLRAVQTLRVDEANDALDRLHDWCDDNDLGDD